MALKIFGRRLQELRETAAALKPGELTERNRQVLGLAAKYGRYTVAAGVGIVLVHYLAIGRAVEGSKAYETFDSGFSITLIGLVTLGIIYSLFRAAEWVEGRAIALDRRDLDGNPDEPPSRQVRRYMERAVFMIQLGYRLVVFAGLCLAVGLFFAARGVYQL